MEVRPGYKLTEVGVIPADWETRRLGDLGAVVRGGSPRPAGDSRYFNGSFIPWLTVASLTNIPESQLFVTDTISHLTKEGAERSRTLEKGLLVIVNSGAKTLGVSKVLSIDCCANDGIAALINQRGGDKRFLCHFLNSQTKRLRETVAAGNDQLNLNTGRIALIPVPFPTEAEQRAIAGTLSDLDALLERLTRLIIKKRDLKQAAIQQLLTGQTRLPGLHGEWKAKRLGDVGTFLKGNGVKKDQAQGGDLPCVRYGEIYTHHNDYIRSFNSWISPAVAATATMLKQGDLLFAGSGETKEEIGKCVAFVDECDAFAGGDIVILRLAGANPMFMGYYCNTAPINAQKASKGQGDAVVHISAAALSSIAVRLPSLPEQTAIAAVLSDMDTELSALETRRDKTRALKQAMMQELLTGKTRLVGPASANEAAC